MRPKIKKELLHNVKTTYNEIANDFSQTRRYSWPEFTLFEKHLSKPGLKILDLGCGNGRLAHFIGEKAGYLGVDISENLIKRAKILNPKHKFEVGDMLDLNNVKNEKYDVVISLAAFHHIPSAKSRLQALQNMYSALKPGGVLILTVWNLWQPKYRKHIAKAILRSILSMGNYHPLDTFIPWGKKKLPRYYHCFTPREMAKLLRKSNFALLEKHITKGKEKTSLLKGHNQTYICKK